MSHLATSNFIYVELQDEGGAVLSRVKIRRDGEDGGFPGNIPVREDLKSGYYTLRAYTLWQLNQSPDFYFSQKIRILGSGKTPSSNVPASDSVDVTFYPEGGRYFDGMQSGVAFKVMDSRGRSIETSGELRDDLGRTLMPVATTHDGMGLISFTPQPGRRYLYRDRTGREYPLPGTSTDGGTLSVRQTRDCHIVRAYSVGGGTLLLRNADAMIPLAEIPSDGKVHTFAIERKDSLFACGINHLLLIDDSGNLLSERLFFADEPHGKVTCTLEASMPPEDGDLTRADIALRDNAGRPLDAHLSVAVVKGGFAGYLQDDDLVSWTALSSELKGRINNPSWYFDGSVPESRRKACLDLLMMVQGWRYYDLDKILDLRGGDFVIRHLREYAQSIRGSIARPAGRKMPEKFVFSVIVPSLRFNRFISVSKADRFVLDSIDFQENTEFLISATRSGLGADYIPRWSGDVFAPSYRHARAPGKAGVTISADDIPESMGIAAADTLEAAVVTAEDDDPFGGGAGARKVGADDFRTYAHYTLVEYLVMRNPSLEYNGENMYNRRMRTVGFQATVSPDEDVEEMQGTYYDDTNERGLVKLVEDNSEISWWTYEQVRMEDVEALYVSTSPESFYNAEGGVVTIKVRPGGHAVSRTDESLLYFVPLGYRKPSRFYSPRYDLGDPYDPLDMRNTLYWNPSVSVAGGSATVEFCAAGRRDGPYVVTVQGLTSDGRPVSLRTKIK